MVDKFARLLTLALLTSALNGQTFLINAGGPQTGAYSADHSFVGGAVYTDSSMGPAQWRTQRYGTLFSYVLSVPDGQYDIEIQATEPNSLVNAPGKRLFTIAVNGIESADIDLYAIAGFRGKYTHKVKTKAVGETITVAFRGKVGNALLNSLRVIRSQPKTVFEKFVIPPGTPAGATLTYTLKKEPRTDFPVFVYEAGTDSFYKNDMYPVYLNMANPARVRDFEIKADYIYSSGAFLIFVYTSEE